jgi:type II secretory pathway component PulK
MRKGFGLIMAIAFIVLVATIGALALSFSTQASKQTSDVYLRAQAELLALSAAEYAILALSAHNISANNNCINKIDINHSSSVLFNIDVTLRYIGNGLPAAGCTILDKADAISTRDSNVTVLMDVIVQANSTDPIRIHRRTLQKL